MKRFFAWVERYQRHLSAAALVAGFIFDTFFFDRVDLLKTQLVFALYTLICATSILLLHSMESRAGQDSARPRWRSVLPLATQFSLGGLWSAFLIFYAHSAVISASWPFLLLLVAVFIGNEYFSRYHDRLVFSSTLFFFALLSYAIFALPLLTGTLGTLTFLGSGVAALFVFWLFLRALRSVGRERYGKELGRIRTGALSVLVLINVFYFTNILPPLPLSAAAAGVYHEVTRIPGGYTAQEEAQRWGTRYLGFPPRLTVKSGETVAAYVAVFAPTSISTRITHRWEWYDEAAGKWTERTSIGYPIAGGRGGGFRGYTEAAMRQAGDWRVNVETADGRLIARIPFRISITENPAPRAGIILEK